MFGVTIARPELIRVLRSLQRGTAFVRNSVSIGSQELLLRPIAFATEQHMLFRLNDDLAPPVEPPAGCCAWLTFGRRQRRGQAAGGLFLPGRRQRLDILHIPGPGMHRLFLVGGDRSRLMPVKPVPQRWSRTAGALGANVWRRLTELTYGIIGAGRTGSAVADLLTSLGARRLELIDRDRLEESNLGEMTRVTGADVGRSKVVALAQRLGAGGDGRPQVEPLARSITHLRSLQAVQECDVLFSCVDHDAARLATAALAVLFLKPLVDIGVGVHGHGSARQMGADIRLVIPGERCLLCSGGLGDEAGARAVLRSPDAEDQMYAARDWRQERAGSLRSLNLLAASLAGRLWEDFVAERLTASTWVHGEFDIRGRLRVDYPLPMPRPACPLCRLMGWGDEGVPAAAQLFREPAG